MNVVGLVDNLFSAMVLAVLQVFHGEALPMGAASRREVDSASPGEAKVALEMGRIEALAALACGWGCAWTRHRHKGRGQPILISRRQSRGANLEFEFRGLTFLFFFLILLFLLLIHGWILWGLHELHRSRGLEHPSTSWLRPCQSLS